jgi:hypothetical protein
MNATLINQVILFLGCRFFYCGRSLQAQQRDGPIRSEGESHASVWTVWILQGNRKLIFLAAARRQPGREFQFIADMFAEYC